MLEAHEAATKALKSCRETHGLSVERVEYVMEAMEEVSEDSRYSVSVSGFEVRCVQPHLRH